jgi:hypothetical protein
VCIKFYFILFLGVQRQGKDGHKRKWQHHEPFQNIKEKKIK